LPGRTAASAPSDATAVVAAMLIAFRASVCLVPGSSVGATCCGGRSFGATTARLVAQKTARLRDMRE
jgi:hypothetical protein